MDYFADGHRGAAILSACFLSDENPVEPGAAATMAALIDHHWLDTDLCAPFPDEPVDPALQDRIVAALSASIGELRQAGHNVIFPSLALKAFAQLPGAVTPSRVDGICRLIEAFDTVYDVVSVGADDVPPLDPPEAMAEFILTETRRTIEAFNGRGQGWSGHMLTYGRALLDLGELGYTELARKGLHAFALYVARARMGPLDTDRAIPEHPPSELTSLEDAYWQQRRERPVGLGHCFKYPYGLYGLMALARDPGVKAQCLAQGYRIL